MDSLTPAAFFGDRGNAQNHLVPPLDPLEWKIMAALSEIEKREIVTLLGQFARPTDVVLHMRQVFGVVVDRFQVRTYDPTNARYEAGPKWRPVFDAARSAYLTSIADVPIAHAAYRLDILQQLLMSAIRQGNISLALSILAQAARESGRATSQSKPNSETRQPKRFNGEEGRAVIAGIAAKLKASFEANEMRLPGRPHS